jgi:zinc protease
MKRYAGILAGVLLAGCAPAAPETAPPAAPAPGQAAPAAAAVAVPHHGAQAGPRARRPRPRARARTLANGLAVLYVRRPEVPAVQAVLVTRGGSADDPADLPGLASFTAGMLDEGAGGRSSLQLSDALEQLGASLSASTGWDGAQVGLYVLRARSPRRCR